MSIIGSRVRASIVVLILSALVGRPASADPVPGGSSPSRRASSSPQHTADESPKSLLRNIAGDLAHLPSVSNLGAATIGSALTLAVHQVDTDVNRHLYGKGSVHDLFLPGKVIGLIPVHIGVGILAYTVGHEMARPRVAHVGLDLLRAQAVAGIVTIGLKEAVRRERPDHSGHTSFPSGHASVTFATASVLARHFGWRVAVPTYLLASYVAASRLHENVHFLSDVVAGSTLGYIAGRTVTRHGRDTFTIVPVVEPHGGAVLMVRVW